MSTQVKLSPRRSHPPVWAIQIYNTRKLVIGRRKMPLLYSSKGAAFAAIRRMGKLPARLPVQVYLLINFVEESK